MTNFLGAQSQLEALEAIPSTLSINIGTSGVQNCVNVTEIGQLYLVSIGQFNSNFGASFTAALEIQIDSQTAQSLPLWTTGVASQAVLYAFGIPASGGNVVRIPFNTRYISSLRVGLNITVTGSGTVHLGVTRGRKY